MKAEVEIVSVAMAKEYLERKLPNRRLRESVIARYVRDMKEGRWQANGQPIIFSLEGELLDGQHRLNAVIVAQLPISMLVVRGVSKEAFVTMDSGKGRNLPDVLSIEGHKNITVLASSARIALNYITGLHTNASVLTRIDFESFIKNHAYLQETATLVSTKRASFRYSVSILAAVLFLANEARNLDTEVQGFLEGFSSGAGLWKGDPRLTIRNWILNRNSAQVRTTTTEYFLAFTRVWNAFAKGEGLQLLKLGFSPTRASIPIVGFSPHLYAYLPDLSGLKKDDPEIRSNLSKNEATPPLEFHK